jgi:hypothetical protein
MSTTPRTLFIALSALTLALIPGCYDDQDPDGAKDLWTQIHDANYRGWARAPGYASRMPTSAPHGDEVEIFVNGVVTSALAGAAITSWPEGSLIVKDGYDSDGALDSVAAMEKRGSAWYWVEWNAEGESLWSGNPPLCTDCHAPGADMVRAFGFPK